MLCCQRAKIVHRSASQKGPAWAWARLLSALGLETPEHELARPLPLPPEMLFHRERKGWLLDPPALRWSSLGSQAVRAVGSLQNRPSRGAGRQGCLD